MFNLVEMITEEEDLKRSPCSHGNIVIGHSCYCHHPDEEAPRKCHIWRYHAEDLPYWNSSECQFFEENSNY